MRILTEFLSLQARLSYSQIPAEMKRVYHVEAFRPPGCVLQGPPTLPVPPDTGALRVSSPSTDRRFYRQPGAGAAGASDIGAIGFSHRSVETIRRAVYAKYEEDIIHPRRE